MPRTMPLLSKALQSALRESLEIHLDGIVDPSVHRTALQAVCGRIDDYLTTATLPVSGTELVPHQVLITAALHAASDQLCDGLANA
ncbi:hypothetical protein D9599_28480 [Roseomonas sp. KE2513]|uniref:hypothetical protein n=1 Tax=Roseomonas sp. KE2513 TaxID=2479202 RepID=UPI0018E05165|nr:hypothetical protein [Roseomonas sp. KE2513]MBI0539457.1 hypothetical protein [Roseomonas sp. KE2513]